MKTNPQVKIEALFEILDMPSDESRRNRWKRRLILLGLLLLIVAVIVWSGTVEKNGISYKTQAAKRGDMTLSVVAAGNLEPTNQVDVGSELSGIIKTVEVDYNDPVKKGQVLARLDTTRLNAEVLQAEAALSAARANLLQAQATRKEARNELDRILFAVNLSNGKAVSRSDVDSARAALDRAVADEASSTATVSQARATLDANETDLSKTVICSPINGVVLTRSVEPGQTVAASLSAPVLFTLAEDLTQMALHVNVDEADVGQVKEGQEAVFTVDAYPEQKFDARVIQVRYGSSTTDGVVTYETVMKVDNKDLLLLPGMTATADITVKNITNTLLIPNAALRFIPPVSQGPVKNGRTGGVVGMLLPRPPVQPRQQHEIEKNWQQIWLLRDQNSVPVYVATGSSNGINTEIVGGDVKEGDLLIVDSSDVAP